jgi:BirA family transcriptional regulator, biotin operon repressor / biotin---[acetyl-CoA-carboxylase] ligase
MGLGRASRIGPDLVDASALVAERGCALGKPLFLMASTTSTSDEAHKAAKEGAPHGATWVAEEQTAGRGRRGRAWVSPPGEGLLFSVLVRLQCAPTSLPRVALLAGLAVHDAVSRAVPGVDVRCKWPNDVLVGGRKLAGVLVEAVTMGSRVEAVVIGVGINVHTRLFPLELSPLATSVALVSSMVPPDRASLLADTLASLDQDLHAVVARGLGLVRARLDAADSLRGQRVASDAGAEGTAEGIDDEGGLRVRLADGSLVRWTSGEVHLIPALPTLAEGGRIP